MTFGEVIDYLDAQEESIVMQAVESMYEDGSRGIFSDKFVPYSDLMLLGYTGVRQFLTSMQEIDEHFVVTNKGELQNLKSKIQRLKGVFPDGH